MDFNYTPIDWESEGSEPSSSFKSNGYTAGQKLAANHVNFFVNFLMKAIAEIHTLLQTVATKTELTNGLSGKANTSHTHSQYVTSTTLNSYATKASPTFTGTPKAPTPASGNNSTQVATTAFVITAINNAIAALYNETYETLYLNRSNYSTISNLTSSTAKVSYSEFVSGGGDINTDVYKNIMYLTSSSGLPKSSNLPVFFRSVAWENGDETEVFNTQYLLYSDGTMYKRERTIWIYTSGAQDSSFGAWSLVSFNKGIWTA